MVLRYILGGNRWQSLPVIAAGGCCIILTWQMMASVIVSVGFDSVHLGRGGKEDGVLAGLRLDILPSTHPFVGTFNSCGTNTLNLSECSRALHRNSLMSTAHT